MAVMGDAMLPASRPSSTSRLGRNAMRARPSPSIGRFPRRPPRRLTTLLYGRNASWSALASVISSPDTVATAVGPASIGLRSSRPTWSAAIFSSRFLAICSCTPFAFSDRRTACISETFSPR